jgi:hypothetical protein
MFGRLYKKIFTISWYPLEIRWGYVHGMSLDLDKYIYPNCLNKVTAYVYVTQHKGIRPNNIIILMVLRKKPS